MNKTNHIEGVPTLTIALFFIGAILILAFIFWFYVEKLFIPEIQAENLLLRHDNELIRSELNKLQIAIAAKGASTSGNTTKNQNSGVKSLRQNRSKKLAGGLIVPSRLDLALLQDYTIEQDRIALVRDLYILGAKALKYCATPVSHGGGGGSFVGLTSDSSGLALLAPLTFTDNAGGKFSIKSQGNAKHVIIHAVGRFALTNGTFPTYDMEVTITKNQIIRQLN